MKRSFELVVVEGDETTRSVPFRYPLLAWHFALGWAESHFGVTPPELTNAAHNNPPLIGSVKLPTGTTFTVQERQTPTHG